MFNSIVGASLKIKTWTVESDITLLTLVGSRFSLLQWLRSIGRDQFGRVQLGLSLGKTPVFENRVYTAGLTWQVLELAVTNLNPEALLSAPWVGTRKVLVTKELAAQLT